MLKWHGWSTDGPHPHVLRRLPAQYSHLRASMMTSAHINLLSMLSRFEPEEVTRLATVSIYIQKTALQKLEGIEAYVARKTCVCGGKWCVSCITGQTYLPTAASVQWRDKGERLYMPMEHAAYLPKPEYKRQQKDMMTVYKCFTKTSA